MADTSYPKGMQRLLNGSINLGTAPLKVCLVTAGYTYSTAHEFVSDLGTRVGVDQALTNVSKHARATAVGVRLMQEGDEVVLEITDNGCGLAPADLRKPRSFGLRGIRERLTSLGGRLDLSPVTPQGTRLTLRAPLLPATADEHPNPHRSPHP